MIRIPAAAASVVPLTMLMVSACVWQSDYDKLQAQNQQLQAQNQQLQAQVAGLQREASFVEAGDLLFPEGGYQLSPAGKAELSSNIVPKLTGLQNAKVVVYGYTDNLPVGAPLKWAGINDNLTLSSRRAGDRSFGVRRLRWRDRPTRERGGYEHAERSGLSRLCGI